ncbi:MAG TPA: hypothetical protein VFC43_02845 [Methanoregula sp.]|nr:hypothetical protein [Methanoregula sp.]
MREGLMLDFILDEWARARPVLIEVRSREECRMAMQRGRYTFRGMISETAHRTLDLHHNIIL